MSKLRGLRFHQTSRESERAVIGKAMLESQRKAIIVEGELSGNVVIAVASVESGNSSSPNIGGSFLVKLSELGRSKQLFHGSVHFRLCLCCLRSW